MSAQNIAGIQVANRELQEGELAEILAMRCLHYLLYVVDLADLDYWVKVADLILEAQADAQIHVRIDRRGRFTAAEDAWILTHVARAFGARAATLRIRNEVNLESPEESPEYWKDYLVDFGKALPADVRAKTAVPALSPNWATPWLKWLKSSAEAAAEAKIPILDAHAYGQANEVADVLCEHERVWSGRLVVTETNFGAGREYDLARWPYDHGVNLIVAAQYRAEAFIVFIWQWENPDSALKTPVNVGGSPLQAAMPKIVETLCLAPKGAVKEDKKVSQTLQERYPKQFEEWKAAGGIETNFRKHLLGTKTIQPAKADLEMLARECESSAKQLQGALASYPF